jgi:hypothetical protein
LIKQEPLIEKWLQRTCYEQAMVGDRKQEKRFFLLKVECFFLTYFLIGVLGLQPGEKHAGLPLPALGAV